MLTLTDQDQAGLCWLKGRCAAWQHSLRRRRKYGLARGADFSPEDARIIGALLDVERRSRGLRELVGGRKERKCDE